MGSLLVEANTEFVDGVATRDAWLGDSVWVRIFIPQLPPQSPGDEENKAMPLVLYAHGGAYCLGQPDWLSHHSFCSTMCKLSHSVWISLSYRLAPAHRLPAAFDDAALALSWLVSQARQQSTLTSHPWLSGNHADFSNVFLAGESAGANIMLKLAMDNTPSGLEPLCVRGLLLIQPGFHSEEKRSVMDNLKRYNLALPEGETLDYAPVNPMHATAPPLEPLAAYPHIFLNVADGDFRYDLTLRFYNIVCGICQHVQLFESLGKGHVFHLNDPHCRETIDLYAQLVSFLRACTNA